MAAVNLQKFQIEQEQQSEEFSPLNTESFNQNFNNKFCRMLDSCVASKFDAKDLIITQEMRALLENSVDVQRIK
jgi:hypothetical protein